MAEQMTLQQCVEAYKTQAKMSNALGAALIPDEKHTPLTSLAEQDLPQSLAACKADVQALLKINGTLTRLSDGLGDPTRPPSSPNAKPVSTTLDGPGA